MIVSMVSARGSSLIGLLLAVAILLVLGVVMLSSVNKSVTGEGSVVRGTVASFQDKQYLYSLFGSIAAAAQGNEGRYITPGELTGRRDGRDNTTANLFSAMIAKHYTVPGQLISGNEYSPNVVVDEDYDYTAYRPATGTYWDPGFVADLAVESNNSFAHVPLFGQRLRQHWRFTTGSRTPLLGNRGPAGGVDDPGSSTYGRNGRWAGHVVFGDGHIDFIETFTPAGLFLSSAGERRPDNIFDMEEGPDGLDAILSFTREVTPDGPDLQHD